MSAFKPLRWSPSVLSWPGATRWLTIGLTAAGLLLAGQAEAAQGSNAKRVRPEVRAKSSKVVTQRRVVRARATVADPVSVGRSAGLQHTSDPLALKSNVAFVMDQDTSEVLFSKNPQAVLPIASLTKLMTAMVVVESGASLDDELEITTADIDTEKGSSSRLAVGTRLTRGEMLHLALMSSENRAANALGRHHPGGLGEFVKAMNFRAASLGMSDTRYVEPTGLSSQNRSSAPDLARLVGAAYEYPLLRQFSTTPDAEVDIGRRTVQFNNTNRLVRNPNWEIGLQKTGYIAEAGRCLVMQAQMAGRKLIMVFLDSAGKYSRLGDAERVRQWIEHDHELAARSNARPLR
ncbi:D-alanyl-D-alanine endopeptidase [Leptothrix discophora]|uniref:D-alanyl-D-alanine endopeptidase n=1 Tax=Leptothrix discophora TaxID=89 RepID=A0ABT9G0V0_LEPDI|nr:D-alanyl-D-alanine endopeptidase [Leptothrix discophora]MDP4300118.1 D-alanyl-D-alanine endopeptidase [Leptothrix discophora]